MNNLPNPEQLEQLWSQGQTACQNCGAAVALSEAQPLQLCRCPKCKQHFFVPGKVSKYFLFEPCGAGGMGSVYKAVSALYPKQLLAAKILPRKAKDNPADIQALLNEARIASIFQGSQYLAACLDSGFADGEYFTIMPLISGERLDRMIERQGHLTEIDVLRISLHILAAEQYIYNHGYLFRDLKPENLIINEKGYAVLLDFGLCVTRENAAQPCNDEFISGSPYYLPPERLLGTGEEAASELYSLGMIMYYALTGKTYFDASEADSLARRHLSNLRLNSSAKMQGIRPKLAELLNAMVKQDKKERPQDFISVAKSIKGLLKEICA